MVHALESIGQSPASSRLRQSARPLGAILLKTGKTRTVWLCAFAALGVWGLAWAVVKLMFASGDGTMVWLLRDAGHQVGSGGLGGALGALGGGLGWAFKSVFGGPGPTVNSSGPGVQVGRQGSWRDAAPGTQVGPDDYVKIPAGSTVTITLPDGNTKDFNGQSIIPGRWLGSDTQAGHDWADFSNWQSEVWGGGRKTQGNGGGKA